MKVDTELFPERERGRSSKKSSSALNPKQIAIAAAVLLAVIVVAWFIFGRSKVPEFYDDYDDSELLIPLLSDDGTATDTAIGAVAPEPLVTDGELAPVERPPALDGSDEQVANALQDLSPALLQWLTPDEQIRKWVLLVVNMAEGNVVNGHRPLKYPMKPFKTKQTVGRLTMNPVNYERAKPLIDAVLSISPDKLAAYYRQWTPVLTHSFGELGLEGTFHGHFVTLLNRVVEAPVHEASPSLERPNVLYEYADPALENATDLDKLLWRLGPTQLAAVQSYAAALKEAL